MSISQYVAVFTGKMKLVPYLVPTELSNVERFANGLPVDFGPVVKLATTLEAAIRVAKSLEDIFKRKAINQAGVGERRINEGSS